MQVTATMGADVPLREVGAHAQRVEALGYDMLSVPEAAHEGTLTAFAALANTTRLRVGTGVLVAFARSPMLAAHAAWDLHVDESVAGRCEVRDNLGDEPKRLRSARRVEEIDVRVLHQRPGVGHGQGVVAGVQQQLPAQGGDG